MKRRSLQHCYYEKKKKFSWRELLYTEHLEIAKMLNPIRKINLAHSKG